MRHELQSDRRTLRLVFPGDVLSTNAAALKEEMLAVLAACAGQEDSWDCLEADVSAAHMVDSVGLNLLVTLIKTAQARSRATRIRTGSAHVRRALKFTRLDQMAEVVGD